jgi:ribonuclease HI
LQYAQAHPDNYILTTDSQAIIAKVNGNVANATGNPNIKGIQTILKEFKESPLPLSLALKWEKRISNEFMKRVDFLCAQEIAQRKAVSLYQRYHGKSPKNGNRD